VGANNQFALNFYSKVTSDPVDKDKNIFFSPWSISTAFAIANEGAHEETAKEIRSVFGFPEDENFRRSSFKSIQEDLNESNGNYTLSTANALWIREGYHILQDYVTTSQKYYYSEVRNVDFTKDSGRVMINNWIESKTNEKIKDLLPEGSIDPGNTRLVITNAVYFNGTWIIQFDKDATKVEDFKVSEQKVVKVPMMRIDERQFKYGESDGIKVLELPYQGEKISMVLLLPKEGSSELRALEQSLTLTQLAHWKSELHNQTVNIQIPKFKLESMYTLNEILEDMGMPAAFNPHLANFSGITDTERLYISSAIHKAFVNVNEEGTEAAAATGIVFGIESVHEYPVFKADHPFIFIIQDNETGNILFMGKVLDPTS